MKMIREATLLPLDNTPSFKAGHTDQPITDLVETGAQEFVIGAQIRMRRINDCLTLAATGGDGPRRRDYEDVAFNIKFAIERLITGQRLSSAGQVFTSSMRQMLPGVDIVQEGLATITPDLIATGAYKPVIEATAYMRLVNDANVLAARRGIGDGSRFSDYDEMAWNINSAVDILKRQERTGAATTLTEFSLRNIIGTQFGR